MYDGRRQARLAASALSGVCVLLCLLTPLRAQDAWQEAIDAGDRALSTNQHQEALEQFAAARRVSTGFGAADPRRAVTLVRLARAYRSLGDLAKPEELYEAAVDIAEKAHDPSSLEFAEYLNEAGRYFHSRRKYRRAEELYRNAFANRVKHLGREHADVAESINNLAVLYENEVRYSKSEVYYQHALRIRETVLGPEHTDTVVTMEHYARLLVKMNHSDQAQPLLERAEAVRARHVAQATEAVSGEVFRLGPGVIPARLNERTEPEYTEEARIARHEGTVVMQAVITPDGGVAGLRLVRSLGLGLDEKAVEAVRSWRFDPARKGNAPVAFRVSLEVSFRIL